MMQFFDTNVLIYGFVKNVDDKHQQQTSINLIENALSSNNFVISDVVLYEFAFIANKLEEKKENIDSFLIIIMLIILYRYFKFFKIIIS